MKNINITRTIAGLEIVRKVNRRHLHSVTNTLYPQHPLSFQARYAGTYPSSSFEEEQVDA